MDKNTIDLDLAPDPTQSLAYCLRALEHDVHDPLLPYRYFSILRDVFGFSAGALLLTRGSSARLLPTAALGFESVSVQKLRFSLAELSMFNETRLDFAIIANNHPFLQNRLSPTDQTKFGPYLYLKLTAHNRIVGFLLMGSSPYTNLQPEALSIVLTGLQTALGPSLAKNRRQIAAYDYRQSTGLPASRSLGKIRVGDVSKVLSHEYIGSLQASLELDLLAMIDPIVASYPSRYDPIKKEFLVGLALAPAEANLFFGSIAHYLGDLFGISKQSFNFEPFFSVEPHAGTVA